MKYYFFITSLQQRIGGDVRNTLRALSGQTFEDGTPVDTELNVQAPKEKGSHPGGARLDYPEGTVFCSDSLTTVEGKTPYYTVMREDGSCNFHPVDTGNGFSFAAPGHSDERMNAAYALFEAGIDPIAETSVKEEPSGPRPSYSPMDDKGKANPEMENWKERYPGQTDEEAHILADWMKNLMSSKGIRPGARITASGLKDMLAKLYRTGESLTTVISRPRFLKVIADEKIDLKDFVLMSEGPDRVYLKQLIREHDERADCTAAEVDTNNPDEVLDAAWTLQELHSVIMNSPKTLIGVKETENIRKALADGWTMDQLADSETMKQAPDFATYISDVATVKITRPATFRGGSATFIELLLSDPKYGRPKDRDGFHVEEKTWKILARNLSRKVNTLLLGPTGSGKTEIIQRLCRQTGTPLTIIQMGTITDPTEQLVGKLDLDTVTGSTRFDWADFARAIQNPGVVLLDEINRIPDNGDNILFSCLDGTRSLSAAGAKSSDARTIKVHPDCVFFATANIGARYTGTKEMDSALMNRFMPVEVDYMTPATEAKILIKRTGVKKDDAENISFIAGRIREMAGNEALQNSVSTRETLQCASLVSDGFTCLEAMEATFLPLFDRGTGPSDGSSERSSVKALFQARFSTKKAQ